jgi:hypothetical protein
VHRCLERKSSASRWFIEDGGKSEPGQWRRLARQAAHAIGYLEQSLDIRPIELADLNDMPNRGDGLRMHCCPSLASV